MKEKGLPCPVGDEADEKGGNATGTVLSGQSKLWAFDLGQGGLGLFLRCGKSSTRRIRIHELLRYAGQ